MLFRSAARAGSEQAYSTGKTITKRQANFQAEHTVDVGKFPANAFGLYDMHGNVWEWTDDCYGPYASTLAEIEGCQRVHRSGGWGSTVRYLRAAYRGRDPASVRNLNLGFRVARTLP